MMAAYGAENIKAAELLFERHEQDVATGARVKRRAAEAAVWEEARQKAEQEAEEAAEKARRSGKKLWGAARGGLAAAGVMSLSAFKLKQEVPMVNIADNKGRTALMYAAGAGHNDMIELLLERGAEMNAASVDSTHLLCRLFFFALLTSQSCACVCVCVCVCVCAATLEGGRR